MNKIWREKSAAACAAVAIGILVFAGLTAPASAVGLTVNSCTGTNTVANSYQAGDVLTVTGSVTGGDGLNAVITQGMVVVSNTLNDVWTTSPTSHTFTINQPTAGALTIYFGVGSGPLTCTPAGGGGGGGTSPSSDSTNVRSLQTGITKSVANVSGQVVTTQIGGAIAEAFGTGGSPVTVGANGVSINFAATPKSDIEKRTDDAFSALAYAGNPTKAPRSLTPYKEWSAWLDLRGTGWQNHDPNVGMNGAQFNATGGVGRKLTPDLLVGVFGGYEYFKYNIAALAGEMKGTGGTIGSYLGWRISSTVRFDAALGYTRMAYSATSGTATGAFNGNRIVASSGLTGAYGLGIYKIEPSASIYALWEK